MNGIGELREEIEFLDRKFLVLLAKRLKLAEDIARIKEDLGMPVLDEERESHLKDKWRSWAKEMELEEEFVLSILHEVLRMSKKVQREQLK
jgi:chorismate mutase